jgi:hypothetical protein
MKDEKLEDLRSRTKKFALRIIRLSAIFMKDHIGRARPQSGTGVPACGLQDNTGRDACATFSYGMVAPYPKQHIIRIAAFDTLSCVSSSDGKLILGHHDGWARLVDPTGKVLWQHRFDTAITAAHVQPDAFFLGVGNKLIAFDSAGERQWTHRFNPASVWRSEERATAITTASLRGLPAPRMLSGCSIHMMPLPVSSPSAMAFILRPTLILLIQAW